MLGPCPHPEGSGLPHNDHHLRADTLTLTNIPISYITRAWPVNPSFQSSQVVSSDVPSLLSFSNLSSCRVCIRNTDERWCHVCLASAMLGLVTRYLHISVTCHRRYIDIHTSAISISLQVSYIISTSGIVREKLLDDSLADHLAALALRTSAAKTSPKLCWKE